MRIIMSSYCYMNNRRQKSKFIKNINNSELTDEEKRKAIDNGLKLKIIKTICNVDKKGNWTIVSSKFIN